MMLQGCREAHRVQVVDRDLFTTRNSLKSHERQKVLSPLVQHSCRNAEVVHILDAKIVEKHTVLKSPTAAKDAMRRTKAALVFLRSPSSHQQRKETCTWIMQSPIRQPRLSSAVHWS